MSNLVITRKPGERFTLETVDGTIEIAIVKFHHGGVQIGIDAPSSVKVCRDDMINCEPPPHRRKS
jgi:sRNA-binding carbon storage regulator CsrA